MRCLDVYNNFYNDQYKQYKVNVRTLLNKSELYDGENSNLLVDPRLGNETLHKFWKVIYICVYTCVRASERAFVYIYFRNNLYIFNWRLFVNCVMSITWLHINTRTQTHTTSFGNSRYYILRLPIKRIFVGDAILCYGTETVISVYSSQSLLFAHSLHSFHCVLLYIKNV